MSVSKAINVAQRRCINVLATNIFEGEQFFVEFALLTGCDPVNATFVPYYEDGKRVVLDTTHNPLTLWRPGWYRFVSDGELNPLAAIDTSDPFDCSIGATIDNVAVGVV